ncbi:antitoxin VbhA family protein [Uliginosibacterium sp. 31-12]|uniref:antitoxin VbhA family protein n=1 Tax=Uliginosibacterium sp. 31-12 TaxID=3062781 RepID=UPI0026E38559|nr:antitoxin VbhA family protein [Uliginosibacterium sp. 31-12]
MISEYERQRRKDAIDFARGSVRLEGCILDEEIERFNAEFVAGNLSNEEHSCVCQRYILTKNSIQQT